MTGDLVAALAGVEQGHAARGIAFLDRRGRAREFRPYGDLIPAWQAAAGRVAAAGARRGRPVFVCLGASWEFLDVWFGALLLGALPVAVAPPAALGSSRRQFDVLAGLVERFDPALVVTSDLTRRRALEAEAESFARRSRTHAELTGSSDVALASGADPESPAFLQFTSGSTGLPRAVSIPHRAALATVRAIDEAVPAPPTGAHGTVVTWLPLHHDMGLVGCLLFGLLRGHDVRFLSQRAFLGRPRTWLAALGDVEHAFTAGPNFAYQACVERLTDDEVAGLDLSGWASGVTGSEMIRPGTAAAFRERFGPCGLRPGTVVAAYGMAETTLTVTMDTAGVGVRTRDVPVAPGAEPVEPVACVGTPVAGMEVRIVGPDGAPLGDGTVGEITTRGDGLFLGYHDDPRATSECVRDGWLHTGDLGFVRGGELHVTGRLKDLIIVAGNNVMPHELEWHAEAVTGGGGACRAGAFAVPSGGSEAAVLVVELDPERTPDAARACADVRRRVGRESGLPLADVVPVRRGEIPKTSSGKVQRGELRRRYLARALRRLDAPEAT